MRSPPPRYRDRSPRCRNHDDRDRRRSRSRPRDRDRNRDRRRRNPIKDSPRRRRSRSPPRHASPPNRSRDYPPSPRRASPKRSDAYSPPPRSDSKVAQRSSSATADASAPPVEKEKPNFSATGLLAAATNTVNSVVLKYSEPVDSRRPPSSPVYKLFVFKDAAIVETIDLNPRTCWLIGRDRAVADLPVDHPSCSKQHAVLQFRFVTKVDEFGDKKSGVRLYVMDLASANGTLLNGDEIEGRCFVECREGDLVKFGLSTREYVIMLDRG